MNGDMDNKNLGQEQGEEQAREQEREQNKEQDSEKNKEQDEELDTEPVAEQNRGPNENDFTQEKDYGQDTEEDMDEQEQITYEEALKGRNPRIPVWVFGFLALIILLDAISMVRFPAVISEYRTYKLAESRINNSETSQAIFDLYAVAEKYPKAMPVMMKLVQLSMENGYYDMAGYTINTYIVGNEVSNSDYNKIESYTTKLENYYAAYDAVDGILSKAGSDLSDEESRQAIIQKLEALLGQDNMDDAYINYTLGYVSANYFQALNYLQTCYEIDPECQDVRVQLSVINRRLGNYDVAINWANEALQKDRADTAALRSIAIIKLLEDNPEEGLRYAEKAYEYDPEGTYIRETYLIALSFNGKEEEAQSVKDEMAAAGTSVEESTQQLLDGTITLTDYYIGE